MWEIWDDEDRELATCSAASSCSAPAIKQKSMVKQEEQKSGKKTGGICSSRGSLKQEIKQEQTGGICSSRGTLKQEIKQEDKGGICSSRGTLDDKIACKIACKRNHAFTKFKDRLPFLDSVDGVNFDALTLPQQHIAAGSWVDVCQDETDGLRWLLRCRACNSTVATWSDEKREENRRCKHLLVQHSTTIKHRHNVRVAVAVEEDDVGRPIAIGICPTLDEFTSTWYAFTDGKLTGASADARGKAMVSCLDAAVRELTKEALVSAATIALMRDERRQRLLLRFSCCSPDLTTSTGVVGVASNFGTGHVAISTATANLIQRICNGDGAMATLVLKKVELLCVDAASDEVLSGERMRGRSGEAEDVPVITPNLRMIFRDGAHASRRFLSRLWRADCAIHAVIDLVVMNKHSITQRIHNSQVFTAWFAEEVRRDGGTFTNLRAAKHRFESYAVPLSRIVSHLPALIRTAARIARERHGMTEGKDAVAFLQWVSPRSVILLAMLSDAAAEVLTFTRQCDREDVDSAELPSHLSGLIARIESLFVQGSCLSVEPCYTARLRKLILSTRIIYYVDGTPQSLADPSSDDVQHGLTVLSRWVRMVRDTAAAEFPDFTVPAAFHIFSLAEKATPRVRDRENSVAVKRLAQVFEVCPIQLEQDLVRWRPVAEQFQRDRRCGNKEAWTLAMQPIFRSKARGREGVALITVLQRYVAWCVSTSGIEQVFSASERLMRTRGSASEKLEERILRLVSARGKDIGNKQSILQRARAIWSQRNNRRMTRSHKRMDKGLKRKHVATSEASVVAQRREAVTVVSQASGSKAAEALPAASDPADLPPSLQKELQFQMRKLQQRKVEAFRDGALVPAEVDDNLREAVAADVAGARERAKKRATGERRLERLRKHAACNWDALRGRSAWVAVAMGAAVAAALELRGLLTVQDPNDADVFVVEDPTTLAEQIQLLSGCKGLHVLGCTRLVAGDQGAFFVMERALRLRRILWATGGFQAEHSSLWEQIVNLSGIRGSKWQVSASEEAYLGAVRREKSKSACIVLVVDNVDDASLGVPMTKQQFMDWLFVVNVEASCLE